jgi:hypothetical protein
MVRALAGRDASERGGQQPNGCMAGLDWRTTRRKQVRPPPGLWSALSLYRPPDASLVFPLRQSHTFPLVEANLSGAECRYPERGPGLVGGQSGVSAMMTRILLPKGTPPGREIEY